jgi:hypothetical protein
MLDYAGRMNAIGLPARITYAITGLAVSGWVTFAACMRILPEYVADHPELDPGGDGYSFFKIAVSLSAAVAVMMFLVLLTLPWVRHRKRRGRGWRIGLAGVLVVGASVLFADQGFRLRYDALFVVWLAYLMAFTFVRYGVVDEARRPSSSSKKDY